MTYPQPKPSSYVVNGYDFFRLNTPLVSGGDIYESDVSALAFALGPESDVSRVRVSYYDDQMPQKMNDLIIGTDRAMVGRLDANNQSTYTPSGRPARILISPDNLWNPDLTATGVVDPTKVNTVVVAPTLDVIQYFTDPPGIVAGRNDKIFRFQELPFKNNGSNAGSPILLIPFYGRRFMSYAFTGPAPILTPSVEITGININYKTTGLGTAVPLITNASPVSSTLSGVYSVGQTPPSDFETGMFDYLQFRFVAGGGTPANARGPFVLITVSDTPVPA